MNDLSGDDENRWEEQSSGPKLHCLWCPAETVLYKKWNNSTNEISRIFVWLKFCNKRSVLMRLLSGIPTQWTVPFGFRSSVCSLISFYSLRFLRLESFRSSMWIRCLYSSLLIMCDPGLRSPFCLETYAKDYDADSWFVRSTRSRVLPRCLVSYTTDVLTLRRKNRFESIGKKLKYHLESVLKSKCNLGVYPQSLFRMFPTVISSKFWLWDWLYWSHRQNAKSDVWNAKRSHCSHTKAHYFPVTAHPNLLYSSYTRAIFQYLILLKN